MIAALTRVALTRLAPPGARCRLSVLIFHRVLSKPDPLQPDAPAENEFEAKLRWVKEHFNVLPLRAALEGLKQASLPERPLAITFDDGYADNHDLALPVLQALGLPATFFVATGYLDGGTMFNDVIIESVRQARGESLDLSSVGLDAYRITNDHERLAAILEILPRIKNLSGGRRSEISARIAELARASVPSDLMMSREQVARLRQSGMDIGGHTVSHPILASTEDDEAWMEIEAGKRALEEIVGEEVTLFAYPNGRPGVDYLRKHSAMAKEVGFRGAVSTARGVAGIAADPYQIPRFTPWDNSPWRFGLRLGMNLSEVKYAST